MQIYLDYYKAPFGILLLITKETSLMELKLFIKYQSNEVNDVITFVEADLSEEEIKARMKEELLSITKRLTKEISSIVIAETRLSQSIKQQLNEYFQGQRKKFEIPLAPMGTPFQLLAWKALCDIPYAETKSYKDIAEYMNRPKAQRAVGGANNKNPIFIIMPCHRVVGANGKLVGFGAGIDVKKYLLDLEQQYR